MRCIRLDLQAGTEVDMRLYHRPLFLKIHERWYLKPRNPASPVWELRHLHACESEHQLFPPKTQTKFVAEISKEEEATPSTKLVVPWPGGSLAGLRGLWGLCLLPTTLLHMKVRQPLRQINPFLHRGGNSISTAQMTFMPSRFPILPHPATPHSLLAKEPWWVAATFAQSKKEPWPYLPVSTVSMCARHAMVGLKGWAYHSLPKMFLPRRLNPRPGQRKADLQTTRILGDIWKNSK